MTLAIPNHFKLTLGESAVAALAASFCVLIVELPIWAMFIGWISFFTRAPGVRQGAINLACTLAGLMLGMAAAVATTVLSPALGALTVVPVVFVVAVLVLSTRRFPIFNNLLAFFLGLVSYFASHLPPTFVTFGELGGAATLGAVAGLQASTLHRLWGEHAQGVSERPS
ncbi:DUF1097 domain-containing protein [Stutzerimonas azotifigens]|uniref:DUF1097 domain-containing protein n=1 Tax=Stutzerimonas azotifigens TaxID=291995 RepID=A0ABR5YZH9_9GAMM|nr:DUF1097 domain-containing protein [Stutzerimonas azotifigens]MBA1273318.1 DUF1097 domain-containing protein [Stutzerimonas azotifigens]